MLDYRTILEFADRYIRMARSETTQSNLELYLVPSILFSWIAIELFINNMLDDFNSLPENMFELHEKAFLLERRLKFESEGLNIGKFVLDQTEYRRLENKIFFLIAKFSPGEKNLRGDSLWQNFERFKSVRNKLVHPRRETDLTTSISDAENYLENAKEIIKFVSKRVWGKSIEF